jgi:hypothetical protein
MYIKGKTLENNNLLLKYFEKAYEDNFIDLDTE